MVDLPGRAARGESSPSTVLILSGDVHHGYLAEATFTDGAKSRIYHAVCSPLRNALPNKKSFLQSHAWTKPGIFAARFLARLAGVPAEPLTWRMTHDAAFFENQISTLELEDRRVTNNFDKAVLDASKEPALEVLYERRLA